jgi:histidine ammonia-lyase
VLAIEALCACQALDLLRPLASSPPLERVMATVRERVLRLDEDRPPSPDIESLADMIADGALVRACGIDIA